jgi:acetyl-CoA synthetase
VVLQPNYSPGESLVEDIQNHVRGRLAPYEYPREIEFIDALPMTTTGKVQRKELRKREEAKQA